MEWPSTINKALWGWSVIVDRNAPFSVLMKLPLGRDLRTRCAVQSLITETSVRVRAR